MLAEEEEGGVAAGVVLLVGVVIFPNLIRVERVRKGSGVAGREPFLTSLWRWRALVGYDGGKPSGERRLSCVEEVIRMS